MTKIILFDFWGTLVDNGTYSPLRQTYDLLRIRLSFPEFVQTFEHAFMTKKFEEQAEGFQAVCEAFEIPVKSFVIDKLIGLWNKNRMLAKLYPDTIEALKTLKAKGYKLAILSNTDALVQQVIERFELAPYFDATFFSYETGLLKTDKEAFDAVLKQFNVNKDDLVMVGDSLETDIAGAENAGIKAVLIDRKNKRTYENKITSLTELDKSLEES